MNAQIKGLTTSINNGINIKIRLICACFLSVPRHCISFFALRYPVLFIDIKYYIGMFNILDFDLVKNPKQNHFFRLFLDLANMMANLEDKNSN